MTLTISPTKNPLLRSKSTRTLDKWLSRTRSTSDGGAALKPQAVRWEAKQTGNVTLLGLSGNIAEDYTDSPKHVDALNQIKQTTNLTWDKIADLLNVSRQAVNMWREGSAILPDNRQHILQLYDVVEIASSMHENMLDWLSSYKEAEGTTVAELVKKGEYDRVRYYAISSPSNVYTTARAFQPVAKRFQFEYDPFPKAERPDEE